MGYNAIEVNGEIKLDLSEDTISEETMFEGTTAHNKDGEPIEGTVMTLKGSTESGAKTIAVLLTEEDFGNARLSDVTEGVTFSSKEGMCVLGALPIAYGGVTAQVTPQMGYSFGPSVSMSYTFDGPVKIDPRFGDTVQLAAPLSDFGNAQADDVTEGVTFTGAGGFLAVGTGKRLSEEDEAEINTQAELIAQIKETANKLPNGSGGGGGECEAFDYVAYWDEMLGGVYTEVGGGYRDDYLYYPTGCLMRGSYTYRTVIIPDYVEAELEDYYDCDLIVIPRSITSIVENAFDNAPYCVVVCLAPLPPALGWQGYWSADGGVSPPWAIYVPDESVDLYKADTTWAEYANIIVPLSTFDYSTAFDNYYG